MDQKETRELGPASRTVPLVVCPVSPRLHLSGPAQSSLLAAPESEKNKGKPIVRASASSYNPLNERMVIAERQYSQQYSGIYFVRLAMLKNRVIRAAERKWKNLPGEEWVLLVGRKRGSDDIFWFNQRARKRNSFLVFLIFLRITFASWSAPFILTCL